MLNVIASLLTGKNDRSRPGSGDPDRKIKIAACVILLEMANADDDFSPPEREKLRALLQNDLGLGDDEVGAVLSIAEGEHRDAVDLWAYTNLINSNFSIERKRRLVEMIWELAYTDGRIGEQEDYLAHKLANLLHVSHRDMIAAKLKVTGGGAG